MFIQPMKKTKLSNMSQLIKTMMFLLKMILPLMEYLNFSITSRSLMFESISNIEKIQLLSFKTSFIWCNKAILSLFNNLNSKVFITRCVS